ncbi:MAG: serine/threonine protein kinase [Polyangiaceae bacterium]|nr:serine/threonine protein kinase [Polyangiaceae bacterium]
MPEGAAPTSWKPGDVVVDKYVVEDIIGDGGMGTVVRAAHRDLGIPVALKFLKPDWLDKEEVLQRFNREARAAVKLKGEHVARVLDVGKTASGIPFMVMEYLQGEDLGTVMNRGPAGLRDAADWVIEACDALGEAHAHGIIHRDVKPENLFLVEQHGRASVKLLDFGVSKFGLTGDAAPEELGVTSQMIGTPLYMSPEQVRASKQVDHRADIWALGAVFYELLTGRPPFVAESLPEVCAMILEDDPPSASSLRPELPPEVDRVIARCLSKSAAQRYQSVTELAIDVLQFAHPRQHATLEHLTRVQRIAGLSSVRVPSVPPAEPSRVSLELGSTSLSVTPLATATAVTLARPRQRLGRWAAGGVVAALAIILLSLAALRGKSAEATTTAQPAASVQPTAPPAPEPTAAAAEPVASASAEPESEPATASPPSAEVPAATAKRAAHPRPPVKTAAATPDPPPAPSQPKLEIRLER